MTLSIAMLVISFVLTIEGMDAWQVIVTPLIELTEFAWFLYVVGVLRTEPEYLQSSPDSESE